MKHNIYLILCIAAIIYSEPAVASAPWTYDDCVEYAREHNISLRKQRLEEKTAAYDTQEAKAQWQPSLDFATTHAYINTPWADSGNKNAYNSSYGLNAGWTVWDGGNRENTIKRSELTEKSRHLATCELMRSIETDLLQVYMNILYAKESIGIYEEATKLSEAQAERSRQLMEAGKASRVDYSQLQSQYEQDRYSLVNVRATYDNRRMELKQLLELGLEDTISLAEVEWTAAEVLASLPPITESYRMAADTDLKLRGLEVDKSIAETDVKIARSGYYPKISLSAGIGTGYYASGETFGKQLKHGLNEQIGLSVSVPIFDNRKNRTATAVAKVQVLEAQLDIEQRQTELAQLIDNWYTDTRSAQSRFTAAQQQLESATLTRELTEEQFRLGYINTVELMSAHKDYIEASHTLLQAKYMAMLGHKMIHFYRNAYVNLP